MAYENTVGVRNIRRPKKEGARLNKAYAARRLILKRIIS